MVALHERGHSIRPNWEHSDNPDDVMHSIIDGRYKVISARDLAGWG
jgi:hypothetical protein